MAPPIDPVHSPSPDEYFALQPDGVLTRHHDDAAAARIHAVASGGRLFRGRTEVVWDSLEEIPLDVDDAY